MLCRAVLCGVQAGGQRMMQVVVYLNTLEPEQQAGSSSVGRWNG